MLIISVHILEPRNTLLKQEITSFLSFFFNRSLYFGAILSVPVIVHNGDQFLPFQLLYLFSLSAKSFKVPIKPAITGKRCEQSKKYFYRGAGFYQKSQNHRIVGVGRDLCGSSSPTLLPKQATQDLDQAGLEYLQRRRLHNLPGQPGPGLRHPQREEVLPHVQT